ncbi:hypothetical protein ACWD4J_38070 [Streptomyces sp. NPDC002577]
MPDADAGAESGQQAGAVWDQPLPWATSHGDGQKPQDDGQNESSGQPESAQAEPSEDPASPTVRAAAVSDEGADDVEGHAEADREESDAEVWQAAVAEQRRGAHATPAPLRTGAAGGHAVSKWLLGVAVAVGGLLAAVGAAEGLGSHPSAATAKEDPEPILGPDKGIGVAGTPSATPTPTKTPSSHAPAHPGKKAVTGHSVGAAAGQAGSDHAAGGANAAQTSPQRATVKSSVAAQSSYLSVQTSVKSPNQYWSQSQVSVTTIKKLTALKVVVHIAQTGGVANTGVWTSLGNKVTVHTGRASDGGADYVVTLNEGVTIDPGNYVFQFGYNHDQGTRDTVHDLYAVVATAPGDDGTESRNGRF